MTDLTVGRVGPQLLRFSLPILLANILQALYGMADMLVVGNFVGTAGLSAVNIGSQLNNVVNALCFGVCMGSQIVVGQFFGARRMDGVRRTVGTMLCVIVIMGVLIPAIFLPLRSPILGALHTPAEAWAGAVRYTTITLSGSIFVIGYHGIACLLRGVGDSRRPLYFIIVAAVLNVGLDLLFVGVLHMGAEGTAWATVIAQLVACVCALIYMIRQGEMLSGRELRIFGRELALILRVGFPTAIQSLVLQFAGLFVIGLINPFGVAASAGAGAATKVENLTYMPHLAVNGAVGAMVAQNMGAKKVERVNSVFKNGLLIVVIYSLLLELPFQLCPAFLISLFNTDPEVIRIGAMFLRCIGIAMFFGAITQSCNALANGVGFSLFSMINSGCALIAIRIILAAVLVKGFGCGLLAIFLCVGCSTILSSAVGLIFYFRGRWRNHQLLKD
ncbi:MAG: MATE family efflux transporter [Oscillospiraceae bacterium]|nr:MATE family efflux transporter [Oscillospiraceae bacterium]